MGLQNAKCNLMSPLWEPNEYVNICRYEQAHTKANNTYLYKHIHAYKHILNTYTPMSIQITLPILIIKLDDWVAGLHFIKERSGEKIERKLFLH